MRDFKSLEEWLYIAVCRLFPFRLDENSHAISAGNARPLSHFAERLPPPAIRPLGRYVAGREGIVPGLIFRRWRRIATLASRSDPWRRRRPPQVRETGLGVLLHPTYRLSLRRRLVDAYWADPPADEPPATFFVDRGKDAALVRTLSVEAVGGAGPCDGHG
jgi:hypothetical protein